MLTKLFSHVVAVERLYDPDWQGYPATGAPRLRFVLAALPRTGSNLLLRQLARAGIGVPGEYFQPPLAARIINAKNIECVDSLEYVDFLLCQRQSPSGIFGVKFHWQQFEALSRATKDLLLFGGTKYIFSRRRNLAVQAISLETALATGRWDPRWNIVPESRDPKADPRHIDRLVYRAADIIETEWKWFKFFEEKNASPLILFYEDIVGNWAATFTQICRSLGVEDLLLPPEPAPGSTSGSMPNHQELVATLEKEIEARNLKRPDFNALAIV